MLITNDHMIVYIQFTSQLSSQLYDLKLLHFLMHQSGMRPAPFLEDQQ